MLTDYLHFAADFSKKHEHMPGLEDDYLYLKGLNCSEIKYRSRPVTDEQIANEKNSKNYERRDLRCTNINKNNDDVSAHNFSIDFTTIRDFNDNPVEIWRDVGLAKGRSSCGFRFIELDNSQSFLVIENNHHIGCGQRDWLILGQ